MAGGIDSSQGKMDSTELYDPETESWRLVSGRLPKPSSELKLTTINNTVLAFGKYIFVREGLKKVGNFPYSIFDFVKQLVKVQS